MIDVDAVEEAIREYQEHGASVEDAVVLIADEHDLTVERVSDTHWRLSSPDWSVRDECGQVDDIVAGSADDAAREYVGEVSADDTTVWCHVVAWRPGLEVQVDAYDVVLVDDYDVDYAHVTVEINPDEPECVEDEHDWASPHAIVGGCSSNPGVQGHGGGVRIHEVCRWCGAQRRIDTWAQDPETGQQGLTSTRYEEADDETLAWSADEYRELMLDRPDSLAELRAVPCVEDADETCDAEGDCIRRVWETELARDDVSVWSVREEEGRVLSWHATQEEAREALLGEAE